MVFCGHIACDFMRAHARMSARAQGGGRGGGRRPRQQHAPAPAPHPNGAGMHTRTPTHRAPRATHLLNAEVMRSGWLQFLRICMRMLFSFDAPPTLPPLRSAMAAISACAQGNACACARAPWVPHTHALTQQCAWRAAVAHTYGTRAWRAVISSHLTISAHPFTTQASSHPISSHQRPCIHDPRLTISVRSIICLFSVSCVPVMCAYRMISILRGRLI